MRAASSAKMHPSPICARCATNATRTDSHARFGRSSSRWAGREFSSLRDGGLGLGYVEAGVVMEELGRTLTPSPFLSTAVLAATAIARAGTEQQKKNYLSQIVAGDLIATLAVDETAKHHPEKRR